MSKLIEQIIITCFGALVRVCDLINAHQWLARRCSRFVKKINPDGQSCSCLAGEDNSQITVLILSCDHFRGDVEILAARPELLCMDLNTQFQRYLLAAFVQEPKKKGKPDELGSRWEFRAAEEGSSIFNGRKRYRRFLRKFLPELFTLFGIDVVVNSDERPRRQADITRVSSELHYPHISIQRESMFMVPATYQGAVDRHRYWGRFYGDRILVQNDATRDVFLTSGYAKEEQVCIVGCQRMDSYLCQLSNDFRPVSERPQVLMFTWQSSKHLSDGTVFETFDTTRMAMRVIARLVKRRPDVDFVVKFKDVHLKANVLGPDTGSQLDVLMQVAVEELGSLDDFTNLRFSTERMAASNLIFESAVVCAMQSTTVLEAAIAGRPVVLPHFKEIRERHGAEEYLMYLNDHALFDVPDDEEEMEKMILDRLDNTDISEKVMEQRRELFDRHVSPLAANATDRVVSILVENVKSARALRP